MKASVYHQYGSPEVLHLEDVPDPTPGDNEVLVKIHAVSINDWDWGLLRGVPFANRTMAGLLKPKKIQILGCDIAGKVEEVGKQVTQFKVGDEVFGDMSKRINFETSQYDIRTSCGFTSGRCTCIAWAS